MVNPYFLFQELNREDETPQKYTLEPHGDGLALYFGRGSMSHGFNLAHVTECTEQTRQLIETMMNVDRDGLIQLAGELAGGKEMDSAMLATLLFQALGVTLDNMQATPPKVRTPGVS